MRKIKELKFETKSAWFTLEIFRQSDGKAFVGEYYGISPRACYELETIGISRCSMRQAKAR